MVARLTFKAKPKSSRAGVAFASDRSVVVSVTAVAHDGAANTAVIETLAKWAGVAKTTVTLVRGHSARVKTVEFESLSQEHLDSLLNELDNKNT